MARYIFSAILFCSISFFASAQTREELERQRQQLKKDIEETEKQLSGNKAKTKENLLQWKLINNKVELQDRVIENISKDLRLLDNNIYTIQKDINRYDRLLDTLKTEYAKSMVYSYKNRGNYEFLNFIFAASSFNDAVKRVAYLKSYRNYQEIQGENILRTQEMRKNRIADLSGSKRQKSTTLQSQSKEMAVLETQKKEKDRILDELKKQGKTLNGQIASKKKQMQKVSNAITTAIKKAQDDARREAAALAAANERKRKEAEKAAEKPVVKTTTTPAAGSNTGSVKTVPAKPKVVKEKPENVLLNSAETIALNSNFESNKGSLPWPVDNGNVLMHYGNNKLPSGGDLVTTCTTISSPIGTAVKAIFDGEVISVVSNDEQPFVIVQHGKYFTTYTNLSGISVSRGQQIKRGQVLGKVAANYDGEGSIDFYLNTEKGFINAEQWIRRK